MQNKRDAVLSLLEPNRTPAYIPAAFFLHFGEGYKSGQAAIDRHLEYFHYTGMDFVKIQYEKNFPRLDSIQKPSDWKNMPFYGLDFYEEPLRVVEGLVKAAKSEALVVLTLYSPFMLAGQTVGEPALVAHLQEDPEAVKPGLETITESLLGFMRACIDLGLDGFYTSTQGGEAARFGDRSLFTDYIRPTDLAVMQEADAHCPFNILHVCDYRLPYDDLAPFADYPGQIVNASLELTTGKLTPQQVADLFGRPFMGGLERLGILAHGSLPEVRSAAAAALEQAPKRFILAADCTVPADTPWDNLREAISSAHVWEQ